MTPQEKDLVALLSPIIDRERFELVRLRLSGAKTKTLQIMAERADGTMTAEDCAQLSRQFSALLEEVDPITDKYILEVSSPGIDRPLTRLKDFVRWEGFAAKLELNQMVEGQKRFRGTLAGVDGDDVCIDLEGEEETALIPFSMVHSAKLMLTDDLITESLRQAKKAGRNPNTDDATQDDASQPHKE